MLFILEKKPELNTQSDSIKAKLFSTSLSLSTFHIVVLLTYMQRNFYTHVMVGEMVQNSQSLYAFTFNALIDIHEYIHSHSTTEFTFKKYIYSHLPVYFLFTIIFAHIYEMSSFTFNELYPFTFTIEIFIQHYLRTTFAHRSV